MLSVPVLMRETGQKEAGHCEGQETRIGADGEFAAADQSNVRTI